MREQNDIVEQEYASGCYYVVYLHGEKSVAKFHGSYWSIIGYDGPVDAEYFDSIEYALGL
jgi:hypothetical protein